MLKSIFLLFSLAFLSSTNTFAEHSKIIEEKTLKKNSEDNLNHTQKRKKPMHRIAICVGKLPITVHQIYNRARLMQLSDPNAKKVKHESVRQATQALITERVQAYACKEVKIEVSKNEIQEALARLAQQNGMKLDEMKKFFESKSVPISTLTDRLKVQLGWPRAVQAVFGHQAIVSDQDVQKALDREHANRDKDQVELCEIVIYADEPKEIVRSKDELNRIRSQIKEGKTSFMTVAQQVSTGPSAAQGGLIGWSTIGSRNHAEEQALQNLNVGECTEPLPCSGGYRILYVKDRKKAGEAPISQAKITTLVARLPLSDQWSEEQQQQFGQYVEELLKCQKSIDFESVINRAQETFKEIKIERPEPAPLHQLPPEVERLASSTARINVSIGPMRMPDHSLVIVFVSSRTATKDTKTIDFEEMRRMVQFQKIELLAAREFNKLQWMVPVVVIDPEYNFIKTGK